MQLSILAIALSVFLIVFFVLFFTGASIARAFRGHQRPRLMVVSGFLAGLLVIDVVSSFFIVLRAALGHSEAAKTNAFYYCVALFLCLFVFPALVLFLSSRRVGKNNLQ